MGYTLKIIDADPKRDSYFDLMHRLDYSTYQMHRTRFIGECAKLFPDFAIPYLVFKEGLIRIENNGGLSPLVEIGNGVKSEEILLHLDKLLSWRDFVSQKDIRPIVNVAGTIYDPVLEEMVKRGDSLERKYL